MSRHFNSLRWFNVGLTDLGRACVRTGKLKQIALAVMQLRLFSPNEGLEDISR